MLLVASETGHVYTFATRKLQPMITSENGKALIQTCLNSPDSPASELDATASVPSAAAAAAGAAASSSSTETSDFSLVKTTASNHVGSIPHQLPVSDHTEKLQAQQVMTAILNRELHGDGKLTHPYPLPHKLHPSPSIPSKLVFHPHPSSQHLTSIPIRYQNTVSIPIRTLKVYRSISDLSHHF